MFFGVIPGAKNPGIALATMLAAAFGIIFAIIFGIIFGAIFGIIFAIFGIIFAIFGLALATFGLLFGAEALFGAPFGPAKPQAAPSPPYPLRFLLLLMCSYPIS
jgi:hypothetical protein